MGRSSLFSEMRDAKWGKREERLNAYFKFFSPSTSLIKIVNRKLYFKYIRIYIYETDKPGILILSKWHQEPGLPHCPCNYFCDKRWLSLTLPPIPARAFHPSAMQLLLLQLVFNEQDHASIRKKAEQTISIWNHGIKVYCVLAPHLDSFFPPLNNSKGINPSYGVFRKMSLITF